MAGTAQDVQRQIVSMILSQRMQEQADERRAARQFQESLVADQIARQQKLEDEERKLKAELLMKGFDARLKSAETGGSVDLAGLPEALSSVLGGVQSDARKNSALDALTAATFSPGGGNLESAQAGAVAAGLPGPTDAGFADVNAEVVRRRSIEQGRRTKEADDQRASQQIMSDAALYREQTGAALSAITSGAAHAIAASELGAEGFSEESRSAALQRVEAAYRNMPADQRRRAIAATLAKADEIRAKDYLKQRTAEGMTDSQVERQALKALLVARRSGVPNPEESLSLDEQVALMASGKLVADPATGLNVAFEDKTTARNWRESRVATRDLIALGDEVVSAWADVEANADPTKVGALIGSQGGQELLNRFGVQDPYAAAYSTVAFRFVSTVLKATQGSRPSDFDLRMYLSLLPTLTEVGSDSAMARLQTMNEMLAVAANAPNDPAMQARIEQIRNQPKSREDRLLEGAAKRLDIASTAGDARDIAKATREFQKAQDAWVAAGGREKFSVIKSAKPGVSSDFDAALDEQLGR